MERLVTQTHQLLSTGKEVDVKQLWKIFNESTSQDFLAKVFLLLLSNFQALCLLFAKNPLVLEDMLNMFHPVMHSLAYISVLYVYMVKVCLPHCRIHFKTPGVMEQNFVRHAKLLVQEGEIIQLKIAAPACILFTKLFLIF